MSTPHHPHHIAPSTQTPSAGGRRIVAPILAVVTFVGLGGLTALRVVQKLDERAAMESAGGQKAAETAHAASPVVRPQPLRWRPVVPITGTLAAIQEADLGFKMGGRLANVRVKEGEHVRAGAPLASLDCGEAGAQAAAARAAVRAAEANVAMANDASTRTEALATASAVSDADRVGVNLRKAAALAQLEQARAGAQLASVAVGNCSLSAPFGGVVTRVPDGIGKIVGPGEPLFHLQDTSVLELRATIAEADRSLIEKGAEVEVAMDSDAFAPRGAEEPARATTRGRITSVLASLDRLTRRVPVLAEIPANESSPLLAGAFVRGRIYGSHEIDVLALPASAQRSGSQDEIVVVKDGKAERRRVQFARDDDGRLLIQAGLSPDEVVLDAPSAGIETGDAVVTAAP